MSNQIDYIRAIKLNAMKSVSDPDTDYYLRFIFRWYSKTFHTPLHAVSDIPLDDVLTAYYEESYEKMDDKEMRTEKLKLIWGEDEFEKRLEGERGEDEKFIQDYLQKKGKQRMEDVAVPQKDKLAEAPKLPDFSVKFD